MSVGRSCKRSSAFCIGGPQGAQRVQHLFGARVIARGLDLQKIVDQVAHRSFDLGRIDCEGAVRLGHERAFVGEVIELQRHALAVRFMHAKAQGAEAGGEERGVERPSRRPGRSGRSL